MSKLSREIVYVGHQRDLFSMISDYFSRREDKIFSYNVVKVESTKSLLSHLTNFKADVVVVDFCEDENPCELMEAISVLKRWYQDQTIAVCGIFKHKSQITNFESMFGLGLNYAFVKGGDNLQSLNSLFYISFEDETHCLSYALAKVGKLPAKAYSLGFISSFDGQSLTVDKDFQHEDEAVEMIPQLFEDFKSTRFLAQESFESGFTFNTLFSDLLQIEFSSGWEDGEDGIFEDTFSSWIELNKDSFKSNKETVLIYSASSDIPQIALDASRDKNLNLDIQARKRFLESGKEVIKLRPALILFQIDSEQSHQELDALLSQMSYEKNLDSCIVSVFNHPSTSNALRKLYNHPRLLATKDLLTRDKVYEMLVRLNEASNPRESYSFHPNDSRLNTLFPLDIQVTSLTENEITFMTAVELPLYSILKLKVPLDMHIVLIPSLKKLSPNIHGFHYMGFLFGGDSKESRYLRKYVNYIIDNNLAKWERIEFTEEGDVIKEKDEAEAEEENLLEGASEEPVDAAETDDADVAQAGKKENQDTGRKKSRNKFTKL